MTARDVHLKDFQFPPVTKIDSAEAARAELAKIYGPGVVVFARELTHQRFPFEVGYRTHNGKRVVAVVVGRGASWVNALDNAERWINRELHGKGRRVYKRKPLPMPSLFPEDP